MGARRSDPSLTQRRRGPVLRMVLKRGLKAGARLAKGGAPMGRSKGAGVNALIRWVRKTHGPGSLERVRERLSPVYQETFATTILDNEWIDDAAVAAFSAGIDTTLGRGDGVLYRELGRVVARDTLQGVYRIFLKLAGLDVAVRRANSIWHAYFDSGRMVTVTLGDGEAIIRLEDYPSYRTTCPAIMGWIDTLYGFYRKQGSVEHTRCRRAGAAFCEFRLVWVEAGSAAAAALQPPGAVRAGTGGVTSPVSLASRSQ